MRESNGRNSAEISGVFSSQISTFLSGVFSPCWCPVVTSEDADHQGNHLQGPVQRIQKRQEIGRPWSFDRRKKGQGPVSHGLAETAAGFKADYKNTTVM